MMGIFGLLGYVFRKLDAEPAPLLLAFILGPMMEEFLRRAMLISKGNPLVFVMRPISAVMLLMTLVLLVLVISPAISKKREEAFSE
jgi:TctA family transporter